MLESLLATKKKNDGTILLSLDFTSEVIGTKTLTDRSDSKISLPLVGTIPSSGFGVVDVAGVGRCFQFNGLNYFYNPNNPLNNFTLDSFDIEIGFLKQNSTIKYIFSTGTNSAAKWRGMAVVLDQDPAQSIQTYNVSADFRRDQLSGVNSQQYTELLIQKRKTGITITNKTTGAKQTFVPFGYTGDTWLNIGSDIEGNSRFNGYLKYLTIKKITE